MERLFSFRAWDYDNEIMLYYEPQTTEEYEYEWIEYFFKKCEVMQFTGMYDKNNKPIYEGDIVKFTRGIGNWQLPSHKIQTDITVVIWDNERCGFNIKYDSIIQKLSNFKHTRYVYEVIGNMYKNFQLLNV
jgi:uncharacterized phage protein (TIGR01671 family)